MFPAENRWPIVDVNFCLDGKFFIKIFYVYFHPALVLYNYLALLHLVLQVNFIGTQVTQTVVKQNGIYPPLLQFPHIKCSQRRIGGDSLLFISTILFGWKILFFYHQILCFNFIIYPGIIFCCYSRIFSVQHIIYLELFPFLHLSKLCLSSGWEFCYV